MIDTAMLTAKIMANSVVTRATELDMAWEIADGTYEPQNGYVTPPLNGTSDAVLAWDRLMRQQRTYGPRVVDVKVGSAVGSINWGGDSAQLDESLAALKLNSLARRVARDLIVSGITAVHVRGDEQGSPKITRLGGYLEPYTDPDDVDTVTGLFQAWQPLQIVGGGGVRRWRARVYDFEENVIREWADLASPSALSGAPSAIYGPVGLKMPKFQIWHMNREGLVLGEILSAIPLFMALWATEARITRSEELAAYPMMKAIGQGIRFAGGSMGPASVITGEAGSVIEWMEPGNLDQLRMQKRDRAERLREDMALPGGFFGNDSPSGEAISQANVLFKERASSYSAILSELMTEVVADYAEFLGIEPVPVSISPNREYIRDQILTSVSALYKDGLIPLSVAAREIQPYFGTYSDDELQSFLESDKMPSIIGAGNAKP